MYFQVSMVNCEISFPKLRKKLLDSLVYLLYNVTLLFFRKYNLRFLLTKVTVESYSLLSPRCRWRSRLFARILLTLCKANVQVTAVHWASKSVVLAAVVGSLTARVTASLANYLQFTPLKLHQSSTVLLSRVLSAADGVVFCERLLD